MTASLPQSPRAEVLRRNSLMGKKWICPSGLVWVSCDAAARARASAVGATPVRHQTRFHSLANSTCPAYSTAPQCSAPATARPRTATLQELCGLGRKALLCRQVPSASVRSGPNAEDKQPWDVNLSAKTRGSVLQRQSSSLVLCLCHDVGCPGIAHNDHPNQPPHCLDRPSPN